MPLLDYRQPACELWTRAADHSEEWPDGIMRRPGAYFAGCAFTPSKLRECPESIARATEADFGKLICGLDASLESKLDYLRQLIAASGDQTVIIQADLAEARLWGGAVTQCFGERLRVFHVVD